MKDANLLGIAALETQLLGLTSDLHNLRAAQDALALAMKRCCSNDTAIALLVRAAVEEHLAVSKDSYSEDSEKRPRQMTFYRV